MPDLSTSTFILPTSATLTAEQSHLQQQVLAFIRQHRRDERPAVFVIEGDAGSGKSVVLNAVFTAVQRAARRGDDEQLAGLDARLLVNHNEMLKVYKEVAATTPALRKKDFDKPTPFINRQRKVGRRADVVFVDEAHLLLSRSDPFNKFTGTNQLDELLALTHVLVLVFDPDQVVKLKSHWDGAMLRRHLQGCTVTTFKLNAQMRVQDSDVSDWINALIHQHLLPLPHPRQFELHVFDDGQPLYDWVRARNAKYGLSRLVATTDFPFRVFDHRVWYVDAGTLHLPWDKINFTDRPWASRPETVDEVGSIYTIQGFDLNFAGVIIGPSIDYDPATDRIVVHPDRFEDQEAFRRRSDIADLNGARIDVVLHTLNILLKRGRMGLGIYACQPRLRRRLRELG